MEIRQFDYIDPTGKSYPIERRENRIDIAVFDYSRDIKKNCEACHNQAINLSCPPHSPYFPDYIANTKMADVICFRIPLSKF